MFLNSTYIDEIRQNKNNITVDNMASKILYNINEESQIPINIFGIVKYLKFPLFFAHPKREFVATIRYQNDEFMFKKQNLTKCIIISDELSIIERRYLTSLVFCDFVLNGKKDEQFRKNYDMDLLNKNASSKYSMLARAILMPQKEFSAFINSPIVKNESYVQKVKLVAEAFMVEENIVKLRMEELGYM